MATTSDAQPALHSSPGDAAEGGRAPATRRDGLVRTALVVWTAIGIAALVVAGWLLAGRLALVVVPLLLALFPAALLAPAVNALRRLHLPRPLAVGIVLVAATAVVAGVVALLVPAFVSQLPQLTQSLTDAAARLEGLLRQLPFVSDTTTLGQLAQQAANALGTSIDSAVRTVLDLLAGLVLLLVVLALYLTGGARIAGTATIVVPRRYRPDAGELLDRVWHTLASYTRALFLVALFDAVSIGIGLWVLGVPLVLPLAVLVFFGAFVPYVGAFVTGLLAVLVAFASGGVGSAIAVFVLIVVVQQIEGNVIQPLLMGHVVRVSAFTVIVAIGVGATLLGVLGAFLAVPAAACGARAINFIRERREGSAAPPSQGTRDPQG